MDQLYKSEDMFQNQFIATGSSCNGSRKCFFEKYVSNFNTQSLDTLCKKEDQNLFKKQINVENGQKQTIFIRDFELVDILNVSKISKEDLNFNGIIFIYDEEIDFDESKLENLLNILGNKPKENILFLILSFFMENNEKSQTSKINKLLKVLYKETQNDQSNQFAQIDDWITQRTYFHNQTQLFSKLVSQDCYNELEATLSVLKLSHLASKINNQNSIQEKKETSCTLI